MNLEKLVAKRANARLDAVAPNPYKKQTRFPFWAKLALPTAAVFAIVAVSITVSVFAGGAKQESAPSGGTAFHPVPGQETAQEPGPELLLIDGSRYTEQSDPKALPRCIEGKTITELKGEKIGEVTTEVNDYLATKGGFGIYRIAGSKSKAALMATDDETVYFYLYDPVGSVNSKLDEPSLISALEYNGVTGSYSVEAYGLGRSESNVFSYASLLHTFAGNEAETIVASIDSLQSDFNGFYEKVNDPATKRNPEGSLMGVTYLFTVTDGVDVFSLSYVSQFHAVSFWNSRIDIYDSDAFEILDKAIEMDYDENYDPDQILRQ